MSPSNQASARVRAVRGAVKALDGDLERALGLWCASAAALRGLLPPAPDDNAGLIDWWRRGTEALLERSGSGLYAVERDLGPREVRRALRCLSVVKLGHESEPDDLLRALAADPGLVGNLYATLARPKARKAVGRFYTDGPLVERALAGLLRPGDRVLDPACGGGRFLLDAFDRLASGAPHEARAEIAERCLFGVDVDPTAVAICRATLHLACATADRPKVNLTDHVRVGDPLLGMARAREQTEGLWGWSAEHGRYAGCETGRREGPPMVMEAVEEEIRPLFAGDFDAVVGNPPYRGGRHRPLGGHDALFRKTFEAAQYQLDPCWLFVELGLACLKSGGRLAMVVPNVWMSNTRATRFRRLLVGDNELEAIIELPADAFGAEVETVIIRVRRGGQTAGVVPVWGAGHPGAQQGDAKLIRDPARPEAPLAMARDETDVALLEASRAWRATLGQVAEIARGVNPYHHLTHTPEQIEARVHHADHQRDTTYVPELRGRDLGDYRLWWSGVHWLSYGSWLKEPRDPNLFRGPRLLVRKVFGAQSLCAAYTDEPLCCDQSVYIAKLSVSASPLLLWPAGALLAILNSRIVARVLRCRHQEHDELFPQLKVTELRSLPLPPVEPSSQAVNMVAAAALSLQRLEKAQFAALDNAARQIDPDAHADLPLRAKIRGQLQRSGWPEAPNAEPADLARIDQIRALRETIERDVAALYGVDPV